VDAVKEGLTATESPSKEKDPNPTFGPAESVRDIRFYGYDKFLDPKYIWETSRAIATCQAAVLLWLDPKGGRPADKVKTPGLDSYLNLVRAGIDGMHPIAEQKGDHFPDKNFPEPGPWARFLEASCSLWYYAIAYDFAASPEAKEAGIDDAELTKFYTELADGPFHRIVLHMQNYYKAPWPDPSAPLSYESAACGNNWTGREFAGVGMAALAMKDRFEAEPADSQRHKDYDAAMKMCPMYSVRFLKSSSQPGKISYWYEGPHYLMYWSEYFITYVHALKKIVPNLDPALSLDPGQPLQDFLQTHARIVVRDWKDKAGDKVIWGMLPLEDGFIVDGGGQDTTIPFLEMSAWGTGDTTQFLDAARRLKLSDPEFAWLLLDSPVLKQMNDAPSQDPPNLWAIDDGLALACTGSTDSDLTVLLKNTRTRPQPKPKGGDKADADEMLVPTIKGHSHSDNGSVQAYAYGDPVLICPGYGGNGDQGKFHEADFTPWTHQNVPLIEDPAGKGYPDEIRKIVGADDDFILMARPYTDERKTEAFEITGKNGKAKCLRTDLGLAERFVIVPNATSILIVDRLKKAAKLKLCWWGYGDVADSTASVQPDGSVQYTRSKDAKTRIKSILGGVPYTTTPVEGQYGVTWNMKDVLLTGVHYTSSAPVLYSATVVEISPSGSWSLDPKVATDGQGNIVSVGTASADEYVLPTTWGNQTK
jgi:hypothetical protein